MWSIRGLVLFLAFFAQIHAGLAAVDGARSWLFPTAPISVSSWLSALFLASALVGLLVAEFRVLGWLGQRSSWRMAAGVGLAGSFALLAAFWTMDAVPAAMLDAVALVLIWPKRNMAGPEASQSDDTFGFRRAAPRSARVAAHVFILVVIAAAMLRPWYIRWGIEGDGEERRVFPTDALTAEPAAQHTRAVTIHAPPATVWAWLSQLGADRAGFYAYDWMERAFGFDITNAYRLVPEWQRDRAVGELVIGSSRGYMARMFGRALGWRVSAWRPTEAIVLSLPVVDWSLLLTPTPSGETRLVARARAPLPAGGRTYLLEGLEFFVLGPAHFIMERKMMLTLKQLAEHGTSSG